MSENEERDSRLVLPTLAYAQKMQFDCNNYDCQGGAFSLVERHSIICPELLIIHHQALDNGDNGFQTIVRHGNGEAVYLRYDYNESIVFPLIADWLKRLHTYEGIPNA